jgi:hypothetical protein
LGIPHLKKKFQTGGMPQVVESLPSKCKAEFKTQNYKKKKKKNQNKKIKFSFELSYINNMGDFIVIIPHMVHSFHYFSFCG